MLKPVTILTLAVGDLVRDDRNLRGKVARFTRNHVHILWDDDVHRGGYTDGDLKAMGIVKASPFDVEDTRPE